MSSPVARLGDTSDHGGVLISASDDVFANNIGVVRLGDLHDCPIPGHGITPMVTSSQTVHANNRGVVRIGDQAACGAAVSSASPNVAAG